MIATQRRLLAIVLGTVVVSGLVGGVVGRSIKSPAQRAAETAPPSASLITVPVERRTLSADLVVRGTARHAAPVAVTFPGSALKPTPGTYTIVPQLGATLNEGTSALSVSGRPVFDFTGARPMYRDLALGAKGEDVRQLKEALARAGANPGPINDTYDARTAAAVASFYDKAGWAPFGATEAQRTALRAARDASNQADEKKLQAALSLDNDVAAAQAKVDAANAAVATTTRAVELARTTATRDDATAAADVTTKDSAAKNADAALRAAQRKRASADANTPQSDRDAMDAAVEQARVALEAARSDLSASQATASAVSAAGASAVQHAIADAAQAALDAKRAATERDRARGGNARALVDLATRQADAARTDYNDLAAHTGVQVPADEVLFFPSLPLRVDEVKVKAGDVAKDAFMTVSGLQFVIDSSLTPNDAKLVTAGAKVLVEEPDLKISTPGDVSLVADRPGTNGVDPQKLYLQVTPRDAPPQLLGASVKLTIALTTTSGDVLAVPTSALTVGADGAPRVQVERSDHTTHYVAVTPGLVAQGLVEVTAPKGDLAAGDNVVVGARKPGFVPPGAAAAPSTTSTTPSTTSTSVH